MPQARVKIGRNGGIIGQKGESEGRSIGLFVIFVVEKDKKNASEDYWIDVIRRVGIRLCRRGGTYRNDQVRGF